jgi:predicted lipoprotein with Yx(FWY)xxD motif
MRHRLPLAALAAACALLVAACGSNSNNNSSSTPSASATSTGSSPASASSSGGNASAATTVRTATGSLGTHLVDGSGRTLYLWVADTSNRSTCTGACADAWPPLTASATPKAGGGARQSLLGTSARSDGTREVTYAGHPLYYYAGDTGSGQTSGQGSDGFGAPWWVVAPSGSAIQRG